MLTKEDHEIITRRLSESEQADVQESDDTDYRAMLAAARVRTEFHSTFAQRFVRADWYGYCAHNGETP